jgi:hypothetical protein
VCVTRALGSDDTDGLAIEQGRAFRWHGSEVAAGPSMSLLAP